LYFVVAAGNGKSLANDITYSCSFNNAIYVGAIDNIGIH